MGIYPPTQGRRTTKTRRIPPQKSSAYITLQDKIFAFAQTVTLPFVNTTRRQQLAELSAEVGLTEDEAEEETKRLLYITSLSLLSVAGGSLIYAPLAVPGFLVVTYIYARSLHAICQTIIHEGRIKINVHLSTITTTTAFIGGYYFLVAFCCWQTQLIIWLTSRTERNLRKSLANLFGEQPRTVWVVVDEKEVEMPFHDVQLGDRVVVIAGQTVPVDGTVMAGAALIDQHMLTGEGQPIEKEIGDSVYASTIILSGRITVLVERTGEDMVSTQIGVTLNKTADFNLSMKSRVESFTSKSLLASYIASGVMLLTSGLQSTIPMIWIQSGVRMFVIGPLTMLNYLHILSGQGVLVKDGRSLEMLDTIDTVIFDKTGTLTVEQPTVQNIFCCSKLSEAEILIFAAAAEYRQTHPIAKAILKAAQNEQLDVPQITDNCYEVGYGIKVSVDEKAVLVGSHRFMSLCHVVIPGSIQQEQERCHAEGYSLVHVAVDNQLVGSIELRPTIRPEVKEVTRRLQENGKTLYIISGDQEAPTRRLAEELGIHHYFANILPENKAELVK